jgi:acetolactate synthase-1/2/3 large subunit
VNYCCPLPTFFENFNANISPKNPSQYVDRINNLKNNFPQESEQEKEFSLNPNSVMRWISKTFIDAKGYVVDVGQHQMWAAQSIDFKKDQLFLTSGGLGAMGFALPAAIGASVTQEGKWVVIVGDGCLQLSSNEILTAVQYDLPIAICLINNMQHGMVAQFQEEYLDSRFTGTKNDYSVPDFCGLARVYGVKQTYQVSNQSDLSSLGEKLTKWVSGPIFIEIIIDFEAKALPKRK